MEQLKIIETPRDAMQGIDEFIPTEKKIDYINALLKVGFDIIDFGSFVSPKAIPQLRDTQEVLQNLHTGQSKTKLSAIVGNAKLGHIAASHAAISYLGFPFSVSETFLKKNINSNFEKSLQTIRDLLELCNQKNKNLLIYLSMAFGNPWDESWSIALVMDWIGKLRDEGVSIISISDTIGISKLEVVSELFRQVIPAFPDVRFGFHMHVKHDDWYNKIDAAYSSGCRMFDTVINGFGGCPMAEEELVGNLNTLHLLKYLRKNNISHSLNEDALNIAFAKSTGTFPMTNPNFS